MLHELHCPICNKTSSINTASFISDRSYLYHCKQCFRKFLLFSKKPIFIKKEEPDLSLNLLPAASAAQDHDIRNFELNLGGESLELDHKPSTKFMENEPAFEFHPPENKKTNSLFKNKEMHSFLREELNRDNNGQANDSDLLRPSPNALKSLKKFIEKEFRSSLPPPTLPKFFAKSNDPPIFRKTQKIPDQVKAEFFKKAKKDEKSIFSKKMAFFQKSVFLHLTIVLGIAQGILDIIFFKPFDLIPDLHFTFGKEWARNWKRWSWGLQPIFSLVFLAIYFPQLNQTSKTVSAWFFSAICMATILLWFLLGIRKIKNEFIGREHLWLVISTVLIAVSIQTLLQIHILKDRIKPYKNRIEREIQKENLRIKIKPIEKWLQNFSNKVWEEQNRRSLQKSNQYQYRRKNDF